MAEKTPAKPKTKKGKVALYGAVGLGGLVVAYYLYQHYQATGSLNPFSSGAGTGTTSGAPSTDGSTTGQTTPTTTTTTTPGTVLPTGGSWEQRILDYMVNTFKIKGGENIAAIGLERALSGHCVGPNEYAALNAALGAVGQKSGGMLTLQQCGPSATAKTTKSHTPTETPKGGPSPTEPKGKITPKIPAANLRRTNLIDAARRRANNAAAAARRTRPVSRPRTTTPQERRAIGTK